jgi:sec-independent protein translocase protein TatA
MFTSTPLFIGGLPGGIEWAVILLIAVLLFGANKIPKLARSSGQAIGEFQKGREEVESELEEMRDGAASDEESSESTDTASETSSDTSSKDSSSSSSE